MIRYVVASITLIAVPPALAFWLIIHPLIEIWRRRGVVAAYVVATAGSAFVAVGLFLVYDILLLIDFGFQPLLAIIGTLILVAAFALGLAVRRHLPMRTLVGIPEIKAEGSTDRLVTTGIYSHMRHPRYVEIGLALTGVALLCNYAGLYLLTLLFMPAIHGVVLMEEAELRARFGAVYDTYAEKVPRYLPHLHGFMRGSKTF